MLSVIGFLVILCPLVVFHEFGHYIFARIFGVKAEVFSIGFGPTLWKRQLGETELRLSAIPLGGYVKLLGEDREAPLPPEEARRALHRQAAWKRFFIFFGGPLFNFLLAILVFMTILAIGEPHTANVVGRVVPDTAAARAGFESGDRILEVEGKPVHRFSEILNQVADSPNRPLQFLVVHPGQSAPLQLTATPTSEKGYSVYGESTSVGEIDGLSEFARSTEAGVSNPESAAARAGIRTGDRITEMNGKPVKSWEEIQRIYDQTPPGAKVALTGKEAAPSTDKTWNATLVKPTQPQQSMGAAWGLYSSELFVDKAIPKSPAEAAGIRHGDRLIGVGGEKVRSFMQLRDAVQKSGEATGKVPLRWEHDGKIVTQDITPSVASTKDPELKTTTQYTVGVAPMLTFAEPVTVIERIWNPALLVWKGTERMVTFTYRNFVSIGKMFTGEVSVATLGGPILIGKIAGESLTHGLVAFLTTMAMLSIGLGVLNVLPVPVLDGGHLLLLAVESIRRKPLTLRQMEIAQGIGLVLILALMGIVLKNDISRLGSF